MIGLQVRQSVALRVDWTRHVYHWIQLFFHVCSRGMLGWGGVDWAGGHFLLPKLVFLFL